MRKRITGCLVVLLPLVALVAPRALADGTVLARPAPAAAPVLAAPVNVAVVGASEIVIGSTFGCVRSGGNLQCWGANDKGQLGDGSKVEHLKPVPVPWPAGASAPTHIALGNDVACASLVDGSVRCWGAVITKTNLGATQLVPTPFAGLTGITELSGQSEHFCARSSTGAVRCWGGNGAGELGVPAIPNDWRDPVNVAITPAKHVAIGNTHACAILENGTVTCWGSNRSQQMGLESNIDTNQPPTVVPGIVNAKEIVAGPSHTCILRTNGTVVCWGDNSYCQAGSAPDGSCTHGEWGTKGWKARFNEIALADVREIAAGSSFTCARLGDATVRCWGTAGNWGIGNVSKPYGLGPAVHNISNVKLIGAGDGATCAADGAIIWCWGAAKVLRFANDQFGTSGQAFTPTVLPLAKTR